MNAPFDPHAADDGGTRDTSADVLLIRLVTRGPVPGPEVLDELASLVRSAALEPVERRIVRRPRPDPKLCIGSGVAEEIGTLLADRGIPLVVFDHDITAVQQRNLEKLWKVKVLERTELIIDIFSQRARSNEGKLQVELARLEHQASRLVRMWSHLERQRGGIGLRGGPGERQLELDRRMIDDRIKRVKQRLQKTEGQRRTRRRARQRSQITKVSLIGYTNAGKSTLFNRLTGAGTLVANQLFATLDPLTRRLHLGAGGEGADLVLSDTVGFVRDLPHGLVAAFRATLEETAEADLLLHVVDAGAVDREQQIDAVNIVLKEIGASTIPQWIVMNKIDTTALPAGIRRDAYGRVAGVAVSAVDGAGIDDLKAALLQAILGHELGTAFEQSGDDSAPDAETDPRFDRNAEIQDTNEAPRDRFGA